MNRRAHRVSPRSGFFSMPIGGKTNLFVRAKVCGRAPPQHHVRPSRLEPSPCPGHCLPCCWIHLGWIHAMPLWPPRSRPHGAPVPSPRWTESTVDHSPCAADSWGPRVPTSPFDDVGIMMTSVSSFSFDKIIINCKIIWFNSKNLFK